MSRSRPDPVAFVAGVALVAVGALIGLDQLDLVSLSIGITAAALCAVAGVILVVSGLWGGEGREHG